MITDVLNGALRSTLRGPLRGAATPSGPRVLVWDDFTNLGDGDPLAGTMPSRVSNGNPWVHLHDNPIYGVGDGTVRTYSKSGWPRSCSVIDVGVADYVLETRFTSGDNSASGVFFRGNDTSIQGWILIRDGRDGIPLFTKDGWSGSDLRPAGDWDWPYGPSVDIKVVCQGTTMELWGNGELLETRQDCPNPEDGRQVGLFINSTGHRFEYLKVTSL